jgi:hypothetical protein
MSSSRRIVCSAVTTMPGCQNTPLEENLGRAWTATTDCPARFTAALSSSEKAANWSATTRLLSTERDVTVQSDH